MNPLHKSVIIIGGGPAGLAAALALHKLGIHDMLLLERENTLGGILRQCIHDGFGLTRFGTSLSGPEYADRFITQVEGLCIPCVTGATVINLTAQKQVTVATPDGLMTYTADAIILAMGCRERTRGALAIPGQRVAGVYTAGVAQSYINLKNIMVGKQAVILGSGDIGLIMARRLTLEGAQVLGVYELLPHPSGLSRNVEQCLNDYNIPLYLSHTVTNIHGHERLSAVTVSQVDSENRPIEGTERTIPCDTLILSVGLIPENELSLAAGVALSPATKGASVDEHYQTSVPGIFAAGNVLHVHDLVDFVSLEGEKLANAVYSYLQGALHECPVQVSPGEGLSYVLPQQLSGKQDVTLSFRVRTPHPACTIALWQDGQCIATKALRRALPAEMQTIDLPAGSLLSKNKVEVVLQHG
ncbi:FAD-dependent oxidoreductase [Clostridia bacterium OttesenSCG-928-F22]|nr:FAD-dependent oxidoreductase [Clostridia bacterium OttesenSCG-928-F22]